MKNRELKWAEGSVDFALHCAEDGAALTSGMSDMTAAAVASTCVATSTPTAFSQQTEAPMGASCCAQWCLTNVASDDKKTRGTPLRNRS
eukprot:4975637-Amphidinium_carterae.1